MIKKIISIIKKHWEFYLFKKRFSKKFSNTFINPKNIFDLGKVEIGDYTYGELFVQMWLNPNQKLSIGRFVSMAPGVKFILGGNHEYKTLSTYPFYNFILRNPEMDVENTKGPIVIEDDVWISSHSIIMSGVTVGQGAIIAAGSVVTKSVPAYAIVGGNPAKIIKYRFDQATIEELKKVNFKNLSIDYVKANIDVLKSPISVEVLNILKEKLS